MARSVRHTKVIGNASASSEKWDKRIANRKVRSKNRKIAKAADGDTIFLKNRELSDVWGMNKDGKRYRPDLDDKDMRK